MSPQGDNRMACRSNDHHLPLTGAMPTGSGSIGRTCAGRSALTAFALILLAFSAPLVPAAEKQELRIWPDLPPGEQSDKDGPRLFLFQPEKKTSQSLIIICPGGAYSFLAIDHEGWKIARYFASKGMTAVVLKYRTPRRAGLPKHMAAWQDGQRAVRVVRSMATQWGIAQDKIGALGFSAGGHLVLMLATTSTTAAYAPVDDVDRLACHLDFAAPIYPAYVLEDGADGENKKKGNDTPMVKDFAFDARTPPMCLVHGDTDPYSAMGSVAIYRQLRTLGIPAELHIFAKTGHGFGANPTLEAGNRHAGDWLNRVNEAIGVFGFR